MSRKYSTSTDYVDTFYFDFRQVNVITRIDEYPLAMTYYSLGGAAWFCILHLTSGYCKRDKEKLPLPQKVDCFSSNICYSFFPVLQLHFVRSMDEVLK